MIRRKLQRILQSNPNRITIFVLISISIVVISLFCSCYYNLKNSDINNLNYNKSVVKSTYKSTYLSVTSTPNHLGSRGGGIRDSKIKNDKIIVTPVIVSPKPTEKPKEQLKKYDDYIDSFMGNITMYTLAFEDCEKYPNHPEYGVTASGTYVKRWHTAAADPNIPFGTKLKIDGFDSIYTVLDRGAGVGYHAVDIYTTDKEQADRWGRKKRMVYVLKYGSKNN